MSSRKVLPGASVTEAGAALRRAQTQQPLRRGGEHELTSVVVGSTKPAQLHRNASAGTDAMRRRPSGRKKSHAHGFALHAPKANSAGAHMFSGAEADGASFLNMNVAKRRGRSAGGAEMPSRRLLLAEDGTIAQDSDGTSRILRKSTFGAASLARGGGGIGRSSSQRLGSIQDADEVTKVVDSLSNRKNRNDSFFVQGTRVIDPTARFRKTWDIIVVLLVIYNVVMTPLQISFTDDSLSVQWLDILFDAFFALDILLNFNTAYENDRGDLVVSSSMIHQRYLRSWFLVDLLASLPFDAVAAVLNVDTGKAEFRWIPALKVYRVIRFGRVIKFLNHFKFASAWRLVRIFALILLLTHIIGCMWHLLTTLQPVAGDEVTGNDWASLHFTAAEGTYERYTKSFYVGLLMLVGEDVSPVTSSEEIFVSVILMFGSVVTAVVVGNVSNLIASVNANRFSNWNKRMRQIDEYMRFLGIPAPMQAAVQKYFDFQFTQSGGFDQDQFLSSLSPSLGQAMRMHLYAGMVKGLPFFKDPDNDEEESRIVTALVERLYSRVCMPQEDIIVKGDVADSIYFIQRGQVLVEGLYAYVLLGKGQHFGEIAMLERRRRTARVRSMTFTYLQVCTRAAFEEVMETHPELGDAIHEWVKVRKRTIAFRTLWNWNRNVLDMYPSRRRPAVEAMLQVDLKRRVFWAWRSCLTSDDGLEDIEDPKALVVAARKPTAVSRETAPLSRSASAHSRGGGGGASRAADSSTESSPDLDRAHGNPIAATSRRGLPTDFLIPRRGSGNVGAVKDGLDGAPPPLASPHAGAANGGGAAGPAGVRAGALELVDSDSELSDASDAAEQTFQRVARAAAAAAGVPGMGAVSPQGRPLKGPKAAAARITALEGEVQHLRNVLTAHHNAVLEKLDDMHDHLFGAIKRGTRQPGALQRRTRMW